MCVCVCDSKPLHVLVHALHLCMYIHFYSICMFNDVWTRVSLCVHVHGIVYYRYMHYSKNTYSHYMYFLICAPD